MKIIVRLQIALALASLAFSGYAETLAQQGPNHNGIRAQLNGMKEIMGGVEATFQAVCMSSGQTKIDGGATFRTYYRSGDEIKEKEISAICASHSNDWSGRYGTKEEGGPEVRLFIPDVTASNKGKKFDFSAVTWLTERKTDAGAVLDKERLKFQNKLLENAFGK